MTDSGDIKRMQAIGDLLTSWDVVVRWMPGWDQRGGTWARVPVGIVDHHDAATVRSGEWGALGYIVANNLSQFQVARCLDDVPKVAINAAGISWHPGKGGWRYADGTTVPPGEGAYWLYGAEKAHSGSGSEPITEAAHYAADALFAATAEVCGWSASRVIMHKEYGNTPPPLGNGWDGRKTDPIYPGDFRRQRVAVFVPRTGATPIKEDELSWTENLNKTGDGKPEKPAWAALSQTHSGTSPAFLSLNARLGGIEAALKQALDIIASGKGAPSITAQEMFDAAKAGADAGAQEAIDRIITDADVDVSLQAGSQG